MDYFYATETSKMITNEIIRRETGQYDNEVIQRMSIQRLG